MKQISGYENKKGRGVHHQEMRVIAKSPRLLHGRHMGEHYEEYRKPPEIIDEMSELQNLYSVLIGPLVHFL
jgi:hypothetical protein